MASARPFWKGYLKLSLVSCPIALFPAWSSSERVSFRQINKKTGHRLKQQLVDSVTGEVVGSGDKGRGYQIGKDEYMPVDDEELPRYTLAYAGSHRPVGFHASPEQAASQPAGEAQPRASHRFERFARQSSGSRGRPRYLGSIARACHLSSRISFAVHPRPFSLFAPAVSH